MQAAVSLWSGVTDSPGFPTTVLAHCWRQQLFYFRGICHAFFRPDGSSLVWSTAGTASYEAVASLTVAEDSQGNVDLFGEYATYAPSPAPFQTQTKGLFAARLSSDGSQLVYVTDLGESPGAAARGIALATAGNEYLAGTQTSSRRSSRTCPVFENWRGLCAATGRFERPGTSSGSPANWNDRRPAGLRRIGKRAADRGPDRHAAITRGIGSERTRGGGVQQLGVVCSGARGIPWCAGVVVRVQPVIGCPSCGARCIRQISDGDRRSTGSGERYRGAATVCGAKPDQISGSV